MNALLDVFGVMVLSVLVLVALIAVRILLG